MFLIFKYIAEYWNIVAAQGEYFDEDNGYHFANMWMKFYEFIFSSRYLNITMLCKILLNSEALGKIFIFQYFCKQNLFIKIYTYLGAFGK